MAESTSYTSKTAQCGNCAKTENDAGVTLKRCAKCKVADYCSRECQKVDWKKHKKVCAINSAAGNDSTSGTRSAPKGLTAHVDKPFHRLNDKTWLHDRPEKDVYTLLIDTYRLRMQDNYTLEGEADMDSVYGGAPDGKSGFQRFLKKAESKPGLLPPWWSKDKAVKCVNFGMRRGEWSELACAIEKNDLVEHYEDRNMPMQLRMFGEQVYGSGPGGQSGASMMQFQMGMENGSGPQLLSHLSMT